MSSWIKINRTAGEGLRNSNSNWPTQKSVAIAPVALGGFPAGTVFCLEMNGYSLASDTMREIHYREPGANEFYRLTVWDPYLGVAQDIKNHTSSMVISPNADYPYLHVVTSWSNLAQTANRIIYGRFNLITQTWESVNQEKLDEISGQTTHFPLYPDIDINQNATTWGLPAGSVLVAVWTRQNTDGSYAQRQKWSQNAGVTWSSPMSSVIQDGNGIASSVFIDSDGARAYLHKGISASESTLHYGMLSLNLGGQAAIASPNMPNAACCLAHNGFLGLLDIDGNMDELRFAYWDGATFNVDTVAVAEGMQGNSNQYALVETGTNNEDSLWRAYYREPSGEFGRVALRTRRFDEAGWMAPAAQPYGYLNAPNLQWQDYFGSCCNFRHPAIDPNFIGIMTVSQTPNGAVPDKYDFYSLNETETPEPIAYAAYNIEVDLITGAAKLRGMEGDKVLAVTDWARLSDDRVIFVNGSSVFQFDPTVFTYDGDLRALQWRQRLPTIGSRRRLMRVRCRYEYPDPANASSFEVGITNENGAGRAVTFATTESDVWKNFNFMGKEFFAQIDQASDNNIKIQQMDWEEWQDQDKI